MTYDGETLEQITKQGVLACLEYHGGNRAHTAIALDIHPQTLRLMLNKWRIPHAKPGRPSNELGLHVRDKR